MLKHFFIIAWRNIIRKKFLSFTQLLCLSVGFAAFILVARYIQYEKNWDKFNENFENIYRVQTYQMNDRWEEYDQAPVPVAKYLRDNCPSVENAIVVCNVYKEYLATAEGTLFCEEDGYWASSDIFDMFSFELILGDKKEVLEAPNSIVLSESMAKKFFPNEDALGKVIFDKNKKELIVTGIMKDIPEQSFIEATYFRSNKTLLENQKDDWGRFNLKVYAQLKNGSNAQILSDKVKHLIQQHKPNATDVLYLRPLASLHLKQDVQDERGSIVYMYSFLGIVILLLSCVSFMNLTLSFSTLRTVEIGVRKTIGSGRIFIKLQFLIEAIVLSLIALVLGLFFAYLLLPLFNSIVGRNIELALFSNWHFPAFLLATSILTGLLSGSYPALIVSGFNPVKVLKGAKPKKAKRVSGIQMMVYVQYVLSILLLTSSLWIYQQVKLMTEMDVGFSKSSLLHCDLSVDESTVTYQSFREQILQNSGVIDMGVSLNSPMHSSWTSAVVPEGTDPSNPIAIRWNGVCANYINTLNLKLLAGRNFSSNSSSVGNCIINETAVKAFGWDNAIGKTIKAGGVYTVIGVVKDFIVDDLHNPLRPYMLRYRENDIAGSIDLTFRVNNETRKSSKEHICSVIKRHYPNSLFEVNDYDVNRNDTALRIWSTGKDTFAFFTVMSIIIAAFGLFGLVFFATQRRLKEIGIRKTQGASASKIFPVVVKQFFIFALAANLFVYPFGRIIEKCMPGSYKYQIDFSDLILIMVVSLLITLSSTGYQAIKAVLMNPVEALKYE